MKQKEWLVLGDQNLRYFQQRANTRWRKKLIIKLKQDCSIWIENQEDIATKFIGNNNNRFKCNHNNQWNLSDLNLPQIITDSDNA